ncbi:MAG: DUF4350 domain-containing protein [Flavobacteriales bacterium]|nr:DUF4350 domain-containing protein [Flavobacteriales bacterium]
MRYLFAPLCLLAIAGRSTAQQVPDSSFSYHAASPAYAPQQGPVVMIDEAHFNFHRMDGRYRAFANVVAADGYRVVPGTGLSTADHLKQASILVISNALGDEGQWVLPTAHAFTTDEATAVEEWVRGGGSLFLIADHMPFGGAVRRLARAFDFNWANGYAMRNDGGAEEFSIEKGNLTVNAITTGGRPEERVERITVFTGSAFLPPPSAVPITSFGDDYAILLPEQAGQFSDSTAWIDGRYYTNGAMLEHGKGRVVCFGEAAMFSAQRQGPALAPMGMNQKGAEQNPQLLLNIIHWLDHRL